MSTILNRFSFHCGPTGNHNGLGSYLDRLASKGIPFSLMSGDSYGQCHEAVQIADRYGLSSFTVAYRVVARPHYNFDVPGRNYTQDPQEAADEYWSQLKAVLPPEFDKRVWLVIFNEIDKNRLEYTADVCLRIASKGLSEGYRLSFLGMNSGEPEPEQWLMPKSAQLIRKCTENPETLSIALHEYSYSKDIKHLSPWLIGRMFALKDACNALSVDFSSLTILVTEFGWGRDQGTFPDSISRAVEDLKTVDRDIYKNYPNIRLVATWCLNDGWGDLDELVQQMIAPLCDAISSGGPYIPYGGSPTTPPPSGRGKPRIQYKRTYLLIPQQYSVDWTHAAVDGTFRDRTTIGYSADDAGIGDLDNRNVIVVNKSAWANDIEIFFSTYYPGVNVRYIEASSPGNLKEILLGTSTNPPPTNPPPQTGNALFGLHMSATGWISQEEIDMAKLAQIEAAKLLSSSPQESVSKTNSIDTMKSAIVRTYLDFGGRNISPEQFAQWTLSDTRRTINSLVGRSMFIELHNEPNLVSEGMGSSWADGNQFALWVDRLLYIYRQEFPSMKFIFPGLSPGPSVPNTRQDSFQFLEQCRWVIDRFDYLGAHSYWSQGYPMFGRPDSGVTHIDELIKRFPDKQIWVTEASNNGDDIPEKKANEYVRFWQEMKGRPSVKGVTYFVASATQFPKEVWLGTPIAQIVSHR